MTDEAIAATLSLSQPATIATEDKLGDTDGVERVLVGLAAPEAEGSVEQVPEEAMREAVEDEGSVAPATEPLSSGGVGEAGESENPTPREATLESAPQTDFMQGAAMARQQAEATALYQSVQAALSDADGAPLASLEASPETAALRQLWSQGIELWERGDADAGLAYMRQAERMAQTVGRHIERVNAQAALHQAWREGREALRATKQEMGMLDLDVEGATAGNLSDDAFWDAFGRSEVHDLDRALEVARKQGLSF